MQLPYLISTDLITGVLSAITLLGTIWTFNFKYAAIEKYSKYYLWNDHILSAVLITYSMKFREVYDCAKLN